ncbi:MAG TPA: c-type cytochrome [Candidatus Sulfopaludibacter sp.]|nr:c-type cytochrome [Candidatus Sulfopaludibacter sp.]
MRFFSFTVLCLSAVLGVASLCAQDAPPPQKKGGGMPHKNLKILKDENIGQIMQGFRAALGVQCTECHVQGNFASDENPKKDVARHMITMVAEINKNFPDGKEHVTCYTCHRGAVAPLTAPPAAQ